MKKIFFLFASIAFFACNQDTQTAGDEADTTNIVADEDYDNMGPGTDGANNSAATAASVEGNIQSVDQEITNLLSNATDEDVREKLNEAREKLGEAREKLREANEKRANGKPGEAAEKEREANEKVAEAREKVNTAREKRASVE